MRCITEQNLQYQEEAVNRGFCPTVEAREAMRADPGGSTKTLKKRATAIVLENDNESRAVGLHSLEKHVQGHMMRACSTESIGKIDSRPSSRSALFHSERHHGYIAT